MNIQLPKFLRQGSFLALSAIAAFSSILPANAEPNFNTISKQFSLIIQNAHYSRLKFNSELYAQFLEAYLESLDPSHLYFTQKDVDQLTAKYGKTFGDYLMAGDATLMGEDIFGQYMTKSLARMDAAIALVESYKSNPPSFDAERYIPINMKKIPWAKDSAELDQAWKDQVDAMILSETLRRENIIKMAQQKGQAPPKADELSIEDKVQARLKRMRNSIQESDKEDMMSNLLCSVARVYDPHSDYMGAREEQRFIDMMRASLVGIGAQLQTDDDGSTEIKGIVKGGPVQKDANIKLGDHIIAVDTANNGNWTDIVNMSLEKVIDLIRGEKGKQVALRVIDKDTGAEKIVTLARDEIPMEDGLASAKVLDIQSQNIDGQARNYKLGIITLPSFYLDLQRGGSNCALDIKKILLRMNQEKVEGIIMDLRNNGGGSLEEVRKIIGLFTGAGPTVQVKDARGTIERISVSGKSVFNGELIVLTNKLSASASEIFAGAIADYGRGIIVGDETTFGKGTVQVPFNIGDYLPIFEDKNGCGMVKLTNQKFYRVAGSSTQLKGVASDIVIPTATAAFEVGESELDRPLPYDEIPKAAGYVKDNSLQPILPQLITLSKSRIAENKDMQYMQETIADAKKKAAENKESLNKQTRLAEIDKRINRKKEIDAERKTRYAKIEAQDAQSLKIYQLNLEDVDKETLDFAKTSSESDFMEKEDDPESALFKSPEAPSGLDAELRESIEIMQDIIDLH